MTRKATGKDAATPTTRTTEETSPIVRGGATSLAEQIYESIKSEIVEHRLPPETILAESTLAERYGVSRPPTREALKRLETFRLVRAVPRVGYIVTGVNLRDFDEIFALRLNLEPMGVELAVPRLTDADLAKLEELARQSLDIPTQPRSEQGRLLASTNAQFHRKISSIAGNSHLERMVGVLIDEFDRFMPMLAYSDAIWFLRDQHQTLVETMRTGDAGTAGRLMCEQLCRDHAVMRDLILPESYTPDRGYHHYRDQ